MFHKIISFISDFLYREVMNAWYDEDEELWLD